MTNKYMTCAMAEYKKSNARDLYQVYDSPSRAKQRALEHCKETAFMLGGYDAMFSGRIISHNTFQFTYGFVFPDPETGVVKFCVLTRDNTYMCDYL